MDLYDKECYDNIERNPNMIVPWYIMAAYAYYEEDNPILSDAVFDRLAKKMLENWDDIEHFHKEYLSIDMLKAGTYNGEYPSRIRGAVDSVRRIQRAETDA